MQEVDILESISKISNPIGAGLTVGIGSTAITAPLTNGTVTGINLSGVGLGYSNITPPQVIIELPPLKLKK